MGTNLAWVQECLALLTARFPGSPRVRVLEGIRKEASLPAEAMVEYYDALIGDEEVNAVRPSINCFLLTHGS